MMCLQKLVGSLFKHIILASDAGCAWNSVSFQHHPSSRFMSIIAHKTPFNLQEAAHIKNFF